MLIGVGHDLQVVEELAGREGLSTPGVFFTEEECAYAQRSKSPLQTTAALFSAKEAFFKAVPEADGAFWTDIEIGHDARRAPFFRLHGALHELFERRGWGAWLSISHSGAYVSTVVIVAPRSAAPSGRAEPPSPATPP